MVIKSHSQNFQFSFQFTRLVLGVQVMKRGDKERLQHEVPAPQVCAEAREFQNKCHLIKMQQNLKHLLITTCLWKHRTDR